MGKYVTISAVDMVIHKMGIDQTTNAKNKFKGPPFANALPMDTNNARPIVAPIPNNWTCLPLKDRCKALPESAVELVIPL